MVCADCGNENASMNRACAYCGARFLDRLTTTTWRRRGPPATVRRGGLVRLWLIAGLCAMLIYLLVLLI